MHRGQRPARARGREGSLAARPHRITTAINSRTELQLRPMSRQRIAQGVQRDLERKAGGAPPGGVQRARATHGQPQRAFRRSVTLADMSPDIALPTCREST